MIEKSIQQGAFLPLRGSDLAECLSNHDLLDLVETDLVAGVIVEFGGPRRLMRGDVLRVLERAVFGGFPRVAWGGEGVVAGVFSQSCGAPPPLDQGQGFAAIQAAAVEPAAAVQPLEEGLTLA